MVDPLGPSVAFVSGSSLWRSTRSTDPASLIPLRDVGDACALNARSRRLPDDRRPAGSGEPQVHALERPSGLGAYLARPRSRRPRGAPHGAGTGVRSALERDGRAAVSITGPRGSGTSSVAAHLMATAAARLERPGARGKPLALHVDVSVHPSPSALVAGPAPRSSSSGAGLTREAGPCPSYGIRSSASLVTALFREIDPTFDGRGASTEFSSLLLLRRHRTLGRPAVLWLDQVRARSDLSRVLRCLTHPERLLPEGPVGLPTMLVVASGQRDAFPEDLDALRTTLPPLEVQDLCRAISARANLTFQEPPSTTAVEAIARLSVAQGWGLSMVCELLVEAGRCAESRGEGRIEVEDIALPARLPRHGHDAEGFGQLLLDVLREARGPLTVGELLQRVVARCAETGQRAPTPARLWRHLIGLERKGLGRREVRLGGTGGSQARVTLAR